MISRMYQYIQLAMNGVLNDQGKLSNQNCMYLHRHKRTKQRK